MKAVFNIKLTADGCDVVTKGYALALVILTHIRQEGTGARCYIVTSGGDYSDRSAAISAPYCFVKDSVWELFRKKRQLFRKKPTLLRKKLQIPDIYS